MELKTGRVYAVDEKNYTVDVLLSDLTLIKNVCASSSFFNASNSSGMIFTPGLNSMCVLAQIEDERYMIVGFIPAVDRKYSKSGDVIKNEVGYRNNRPDWLQDDCGIAGPADVGNFVKVESCGVIRLHAGALSQMMLVPDPINALKIIVSEIGLDTGFNRLYVSEQVDMPNYIDLLIYPDAPESLSSPIRIQIGKTANLMQVSVDGSVVLDIARDRTVTINNNLTIRP